MCLQCGCGKPYDKMGDEDNLVVDDIKKSVETDNGQGLTTEEAIKNIVKTWEKVEEKDKAYKAKED
ncbi:hypothetical protein TM7_0086 [candidate division TM7 genomosp. GTL1]|nr:hypothetical protein TM7_0086 [candidate division TM7 genomosp. GTL1]